MYKQTRMRRHANDFVVRLSGPTPQDGPFGEAPNWAACEWQPTRVVQLENHVCQAVRDAYQSPTNVWPGMSSAHSNVMKQALSLVRLCF